MDLNYLEMTDEDIVARFQSGDFDAAEYIIKRYDSVIRRYGELYFIKGGDKADVRQEGFIGLLEALKNYDISKGAGFNSFANLCIKRRIFKAVQSADALKNAPLNLYTSLSDNEGINEYDNMIASLNLGDLQNPEKIIVDIEDSQNIYSKLVDSLSKMELEVLFYMNSGMDYHMIAKAMGRSDKNIDNAIQRIRNKARKIIDASKE
ncbi:MAG: sigma-70 family RNA polymerase sigma factor [Lachnospiraceae bacterium]|nr:sigma-70 family RNA polymerase sigma factor [Lachnospiraceae bacterium]